jgi:hypothetical protein
MAQRQECAIRLLATVFGASFAILIPSGSRRFGNPQLRDGTGGWIGAFPRREHPVRKRRSIGLSAAETAVRKSE